MKHNTHYLLTLHETHSDLVKGGTDYSFREIACCLTPMPLFELMRELLYEGTPDCLLQQVYFIDRLEFISGIEDPRAHRTIFKLKFNLLFDALRPLPPTAVI